ERVLLIGGGAAAGGITEAFSEALSLPCQRFEPPHAEAPLEIAEAEETSYLMATAAGLALQATRHRKDEVDFRREEYALIDDPRKSRRRWAAAGAGLALLLALFLANLFIKAELNQRELAALEAEIRRNLTAAIPEVRRVVDPLSQARARMRKMEARVRVFEGTSVAGLSPLNILRELSSRLPRSLPVQLQEVSIDDKGISLSGTTNSFDSVNRLQRHLQGSPFFGEVKIASARAGAGGRGISFRMFLKSTPLGGGKL
ncbi:MAG: PilN domain-containing protein, partial [Nitrospinota bacterium]